MPINKKLKSTRPNLPIHMLLHPADMLMQNKLKCNMDGKVKIIAVKKGDKVSKGTVLLELE
jgi:biotin carboxyl carrier protein